MVFVVEYHSKGYFGIFSGNNIIPWLEKSFDVSKMVRDWKKVKLCNVYPYKLLFSTKSNLLTNWSGMKLT